MSNLRVLAAKMAVETRRLNREKREKAIAELKRVRHEAALKAWATRRSK